MKIRMMRQPITSLMILFLCLGLMPLQIKAQQPIKAGQANLVEYLNNRKVKITFLKVGDKVWNWVVRNNKRTCRETNTDEWSVYLSCTTNNAARDAKFTLNLFKREVSRIRPNGSVRKFKISKIGVAPDHSKANQDVTSVEYIGNSNIRYEFVKIADKTWRQGPVAAKLIWNETGRDKSAIYLSRRNPNSGQEQKVTLNLQTREVLLYSRPGFAPIKYPISDFARTPLPGGNASSTSSGTPRQRNIYGYHGSGAFGKQVVALRNGNIVVTDPTFDAPGPVADVGAVYVYNGSTGALKSIFTGSKAGDKVGSGGVTALPNGNFVISSPEWKNGAATNAGAVTFGDGRTGIRGRVSAANSLVGSTANDRIGLTGSSIDKFAFGVTALPNGSYVVKSPSWDNAGKVNAGAITVANGKLAGPITRSNSILGLMANGGQSLNFAFIRNNGSVAVGRSAENIVTQMRSGK